MGLTKEEKKQNEYFVNAQKIFRWPIILEGRFIEVPSDEWGEARENLSVQHLLNQHKFSLQDTIAYTPQKVYEPEMYNRVRTRTKEEIEEYPVGCQFKVISTGAVLTLEEVKTHEFGKRLTKPVFVFNYSGVDKKPFTTYKEQVEQSINRGVWSRL